MTPGIHRPGLLLGEARIPSVSEVTRIPDPGPDWLVLPWSRSPRWYLPRQPPENARTSLFVYHPVTLRSRAGWELARLLAGRGVFALGRGSSLMPKEVWQATVHVIPEGGGVAVARANHPGRYVALVVGPGGELRAFVKVARDSVGAHALQEERMAIEKWGGLMPHPLYAPRVLQSHDRALVLEPVQWLPRAAPWRFSDEVAYALGRFFRNTATQEEPLRGVAHGDCAPWNLLRTRSSWAIIDWENAAEGFPPFFDLFHFFVQSNAELRRPSKRSIIEGLNLNGWVGRSIKAYSAGCQIDPGEARRHFSAYLRRSTTKVSPSAPPRALRVRRKLAEMLNG
jgi:hypothetical protein